MKIFCIDCNKELTKDIYLSKNNIIIEERPESYRDFIFKKGTFKVHKKQPAINNKYDDKKPAQILKKSQKKIEISVNDFILEIPPMPNGYGCCNWSFGAKLHCSCGNLLGYMYLDCYEPKSIELIDKNVIRKYI